ncbi:hypothetical protein Salat_0201000 [Sesamum alatum]|uniref:Uncharacterized protein n=1 Tax=Sesamum alatum TaxID=300844 RepID=A0AAE2CY42_9LAMI|nr:hypothetical protein Salat_0201000 [Sesamum alatum]
MADVSIKEKEILPPPCFSWFSSLCFWLRSEQRKRINEGERVKTCQWGFEVSSRKMVGRQWWFLRVFTSGVSRSPPFFSRGWCLAQVQPSCPVTFRLESAILGALQPRTLLSLGCGNPSNFVADSEICS